MFRPSQSALQRYKVRRGASPAVACHHTNWPLLAVLAVIPVLIYALVHRAQGPSSAPLDLTYELDLGAAPRGELGVTLMVTGSLPEHLEIGLAPTSFSGADPLHRIVRFTAWELDDGGIRLRELPSRRTADTWQIDSRGVARLAVSYRVLLPVVSRGQGDIRHHISAPVDGGVRAAGFEVFLQPQPFAGGDITVAVHNPLALTFLSPWPALVRSDGAIAAPHPETGRASVASGLGYRPFDGDKIPRATASTDPTAAPVPSNLLFHPRDLADMGNALLACGNLRTAVTQARGTVIQLGTDRDWPFTLADACDLAAAIARTEIGFFGGAPSNQITILLAANDITAAGGFDAYGLHTGSSVLVLLNPATTPEQLHEDVASIIAHEMFHGWLGEAIPQTDPETLWFTEGMATWFAARMLHACGIWTPAHAREVLADRLSRNYAESPLLGRMSVAGAAAEVMASPEQVRFAYAGGVAACIALERRLAARSGMMQPLDEVLRVLFDRYRDRPLSRENLVQVIHEVTGVDCALWLDSYVYGTSALPPVEQLI
ncbi:hypothetical protein CO151_00700 [bacterium CG_4_9_14_3_um_filter_65_15]|nr:MAG: hypothetical protein CO151_00700 [bacterium CG_4_9_14_3_um_filter_65_15]